MPDRIIAAQKFFFRHPAVFRDVFIFSWIFRQIDFLILGFAQKRRANNLVAIVPKKPKEANGFDYLDRQMHFFHHFARKSFIWIFSKINPPTR